MADTVAKIIIDADGSVARREFDSVGDAAAAVGVDISTGIGGALDKTASAFARLDAKIESGELRGLPRTITQSTIALDRLQAEIAQLRAQGGDVTALESAVARFTAKLKEATTSAGKLADMQEEVNRTVRASAQAADFGLGRLGTKMGSALELMSKMYFVANVLGQSLQGIAKATDGIQAAMGTATDGTREANASLAALGQSIASLDVVGFAANLGTYAGAMIDGASATDAMTEANRRWQEALSGASGKLLRVMDVQKAFSQGFEQSREKLATDAEAIRRHVSDIANTSGAAGVATREWVKTTLDAYDKMGEAAPGFLTAIAASLGVVTSAQEKAASASARSGEASEAAAEKSEAAAAREAAAAEAKAAAAEDAARRKIAALQEEINASEAAVQAAQDAYDAEVERNRGARSGKDELEELRKKVTLTEDERNRLDELTRAQYSAATAQGKRREASEAQRREDEAYAAVMRERLALEEKQSAWLTESLSQSKQRRDASLDEVEAARLRVEGAQDLYDAEKALADAMVKQGKITREQADAHLAASAAAHNSALANAELAEATQPAADAVGALADKSSQAEECLTGLATAAERTDAALARIEERLPRIVELAAQVSLGGVA